MLADDKHESVPMLDAKSNAMVADAVRPIAMSPPMAVGVNAGKARTDSDLRTQAQPQIASCVISRPPSAIRARRTACIDLQADYFITHRWPYGKKNGFEPIKIDSESGF